MAAICCDLGTPTVAGALVSEACCGVLVCDVVVGAAGQVGGG